jgi:hypothetical protein
LFEALATLVLFVHLLFILFCILGGLLCVYEVRCAFVHLPALAWGLSTEFFGIICPLTYLENYFLMRAGDLGYTGDFLGQYLFFLIYPEGLTREIQVWLGITLLGFNLAAYLFVFNRLRNKGSSLFFKPE